jgi:hypothetical protein
MLEVVAVRHLHDFVLWLAFDDGAEGEIDLEGELDGTVFTPLRDVAVFSKVAVNPDLGTIAWPNGADFAPEFLRERIQRAA